MDDHARGAMNDDYRPDSQPDADAIPPLPRLAPRQADSDRPVRRRRSIAPEWSEGDEDDPSPYWTWGRALVALILILLVLALLAETAAPILDAVRRSPPPTSTPSFLPSV